MNSLASAYLFAITNAGAEKPLKQEVEAQGLGWRPSYQQRGFLTFKSASDLQPFTLECLTTPLAFARRLCLFLGKVRCRDEALALLQTRCHEAGGGPIPRLHELRWEDKKYFPVAPAAPPVSAPALGELIGTVVQFGPEEFWVGLHRHAPLFSPDPGGMSVLTQPADAPSRAWLKFEEAVRFFDLRLTSRDIAVELGCAPGGVILALLRRGISAIGVDPAKLAPVVSAFQVSQLPTGPQTEPWFYHCRKPAALVGKRDLATRITWFLSDMNQAPEVAITECGRMIHMCPTIRSALITLKLTDLTQAAAKPAWLASMRQLGFTTLRLQQLSVHHHELALLALGR